MRFIRQLFDKLTKKWDKARLLFFLHKEIVVHMYRAVRKRSNVVVGIGWVEREDQTDPYEEGKVFTRITYYNMRMSDVYHAFWHMTKRYGDELKKVRAGAPLQVDDHRGRSYIYCFDFEMEEEEG